MQEMTLTSWADFKALISSKKLLLQYTSGENAYQIYAPESYSFMWHIVLVSGTSDYADFEDNFKAAANAPLETKSDVGRPERHAASPQPNNTTEKWKGFHFDIPAEETTGVFDISFDTDVYLKGGILYGDVCSAHDYVTADVVVKAMPSVVVKADVLKTVYMMEGMKIDFMSSECMLMPSTVMMRVTYTKGTPTDTARSVSGMSDYFEPNA
jgi:hypothetical protein